MFALQILQSVLLVTLLPGKGRVVSCKAFAIFNHNLVSQNYVLCCTLYHFSEISISSSFKLKARNFKMEEVHFLQDKNEGTSASSSDANDIQTQAYKGIFNAIKTFVVIYMPSSTTWRREKANPCKHFVNGEKRCLLLTVYSCGMQVQQFMTTMIINESKLCFPCECVTLTKCRPSFVVEKHV